MNFIYRIGMSLKFMDMFYIQIPKFIPKYPCKLFLLAYAHGYASQFNPGIRHTGLFWCEFVSFRGCCIELGGV